MENHHFLAGKIHYFDWVIFNSYVKLPEGNQCRVLDIGFLDEDIDEKMVKKNRSKACLTRLVPLDGYTIPIFDGKKHGFDPFSYVQNWRWWELFQKIDLCFP